MIQQLILPELIQNFMPEVECCSCKNLNYVDIALVGRWQAARKLSLEAGNMETHGTQGQNLWHKGHL